MKKQIWFCLCLCFLAACVSKNTNQPTTNTVEIAFNSSDKTPILTSIDLSEEERKSHAARFSISPANSTETPLIDNYHLLGVEYYPSFYGEIIVAKGDKITIELIDGKPNFSKIVDNKKQVVRTVENQVVFNAQQYKNLQEQIQLALKTNKTDKAERDAEIGSVLELSKTYYNTVFDAIENKYDSEEEKNLLIKFATLKQYEQLSALNAKNSQEILSEFLKSEQFLNEKNLNDRVLSKLFGTYNHYNIVKRSPNKSLIDKYKSDFNAFPKPLQGYFKRFIITMLINDKYDRKTISAIIDDYEKNYGKHPNVEAMKQEIEYGVVESTDLELVSLDNKSETWETLIQKWKGKKIYVDFWASWCHPCIGELPYSKKIKPKFKDVVFIYLALNDKEDAWRKAAQAHDVMVNSYLVTNSKSSKFVTAHGIETIPRYMILDKNGKITNPDAPRPSSRNIEQALNEN
jgi:thiol-disulfide isomerase/thioredoxin